MTDLTYYYQQVLNNPTATPQAKAEAQRFFSGGNQQNNQAQIQNKQQNNT